MNVEMKSGYQREDEEASDALLLGAAAAAAVVAAALLLLCALDLLATGLPLPRVGFYPIRGEWLRWPTQADWAAAERAKRALPNAAPPAGLPVLVLSLPGSERRATMARAWAPANFTWVDAMTPDTVPPEILDAYISRYRRRAAARDAYQAAKIAIDASHLRLAHRIASAGGPTLVLEDDVEPADGRDGPATVAAVLALLGDLPSDWDILYLNPASCRTGSLVRPAARVVSGCAGTYAFVATPRFAIKVLTEAAAAPGTLIDLLFGVLSSSHAAAAYAAEPPLARHGAGWNSTYADDQTRAAVAALPFWKSWLLEGRRRRS